MQATSLANLQHSKNDRRPKSSVPRQSLNSLSGHVTRINESYHLLKLDVKQSFADFGKLLKSVSINNVLSMIFVSLMFYTGVK